MVTCLMLTLSMLLGTAMSASAAGQEDWVADSGTWQYMRVTDKNTTPAKTIKQARYLSLDMFILPCKDGYCNCGDNEPASYPSVNVHVIIRNVDTKEVLYDGWLREKHIFAHTITTNRALRYNERIEIFTDVCSLSNPPGALRKAHIEYKYKYI